MTQITNGGMILSSCKITFTDFLEGYSFSLDLVSHYTTIIGFDSGEGKTWLFDSVSRKQAASELEVECDYNVIFSTLESLDRDLDLENRTVIITDEYTITKSQSIMRKINNCKHLILAITRTSVKRANSPLNGIYKVVVSDDSVFRIQLINEDGGIPLTRNLFGVDIILTESSEDKSEHQFLCGLQNLIGKKLCIIAANGKDNIARELRKLSIENPNKNILVFMDLGNVSSQIKLLRKRCKDNTNIKFFDYMCFEELLVESSLLEQFQFVMRQTVFDFLTPERFYEKKLEIMTQNTPYAYKHKNQTLTACYLIYCMDCINQCKLEDPIKFQRLLDSGVGKSIYQYYFGTKRDAVCEADNHKLTDMKLF